jgi:hypothetical protein
MVVDARRGTDREHHRACRIQCCRAQLSVLQFGLQRVEICPATGADQDVRDLDIDVEHIENQSALA